MVAESSHPDQPQRAPIATIHLDIDEITVGAIRWLVRVADACQMDDAEPLTLVYNEQWTNVIDGLQLQVNDNSHNTSDLL